MISMLFWVVMPRGLAGPYGITTQKNNTDIFTAVRTSNLTTYNDNI
jgi:hypothetical protein